MLNSMNKAVDNIICQKQAGFHKGHLCCEQISALRQIYRFGTDLSTSPSYVSRKAFLSVFTECHYGKFWDVMISVKNKGTSYWVSLQKQRWNRRPTVTDFKVCSGVWLGCLLSLPIYNLYGVVDETCHKHYKLSEGCRLEVHRTFKADRFVFCRWCCIDRRHCWWSTDNDRFSRLLGTGYGVCVNVDKTKRMAVSVGGSYKKNVTGQLMVIMYSTVM